MAITKTLNHSLKPLVCGIYEVNRPFVRVTDTSKDEGQGVKTNLIAHE